MITWLITHPLDTLVYSVVSALTALGAVWVGEHSTIR
jgi:hypothetical protein